MTNKFKSAIAFGGFIIFVVIVGIFSGSTEENFEEEKEILIEQPIIESGETEKICVYIIGAVNNPGIAVVPKDSRLYEVIDFVGGFLETADKTAINLAQTVVDEEKIIIPYKEINDTNAESKKINQLYNSNISNSSGKININTASVDELQRLDGIGESTATKIIKYRNENKKFNSIEEIKNVSGIGESKFNAIKDQIVVK